MQIPAWLGEINFITSYFFQSCEAPFMLFIEANQEPTSELAWELLGFSAADAVQTFFRPKGLRSHRHGRKGKRGKGPGGIPEIPDMIAERIDLYEDFNIKKTGFGRAMLFEVLDTFDRAVWEVVVLNMALDYTYESLQLSLTLPGAHCQAGGRARLEGGDEDVFNNGQFYEIPLTHIIYEHAPVVVGAFRINVPEGRYTVIGKATAVAALDTPEANANIYFGITGSEDGGTWDYPIRNLRGGETRGVAWAATFRGPGSVSVGYRGANGITAYRDCMLTVFPTFKP